MAHIINPTQGPHDVFWGSHGCHLDTIHTPGLGCECDCCRCPEGEPCKQSCVAKWPFYGNTTRFYGYDAETLRLVVTDG